jgi:hypothetical protein
MAFPPGFIAALEQLSRVFDRYHQMTGGHAVLVGGAAVALLTESAFPSSDFDVVAASSEAFATALQAEGFLPETGEGLLHVGFHHPDHARYGFQHVSGALFNGQADHHRLVIVATDKGNIALPSFEDLIADRLAQHEITAATDTSLRDQARFLFRLAAGLDNEYSLARVRIEGANPALLIEDE